MPTPIRYALRFLTILAAVMLVSAILPSPPQTSSSSATGCSACLSGLPDLAATPAEAGHCPHNCPHTTCDPDTFTCVPTNACTRCKMAPGATACIVGADIPC